MQFIRNSTTEGAINLVSFILLAGQISSVKEMEAVYSSEIFCYVTRIGSS